MRLWSLNPAYLDSKGLVALWREALLAQKVLKGDTVGYRHHPQLIRFRACANPVASIARYLQAVYNEASRRGYHFDHTKIARPRARRLITVTEGQLHYEWEHLMTKLKTRAPQHHAKMALISPPQPHPSFRVIQGGIEDWESR